MALIWTSELCGWKTQTCGFHDESLKVWISIPPDLEQKVADGTGVIQQKAGAIRHEPNVNWQLYLDRKLITPEEFDFMNEFQDTKNEEERDAFLEKYRGMAYTKITNIINHISSKEPYVEDIQKLLVLIDDMLWENFDRVEEFNIEDPDAWRAFQELLQSNDDFIQHLASQIMIKIIRARRPEPVPAEKLRFFFGWLKEGLLKENEYLESVARCFQVLLRVDEYRTAFMKLNALLKIIRLLASGVAPQTQYQLCFCLWVTSFNPYLADKLNKFGTIPILVDLLESCPSEIFKLPRIIIATFRNLLEKPKDETSRRANALIMIQCKLIQYLEVLETELHAVEATKDPEYQADFETVQQKLLKYVTDLNSFDEYLMELQSGRLEWSVVHTSQIFWQENADRLSEHQHALLRRLLQLMAEVEADPTALCIACHDVAQYMTHSGVGGKRAVERHGGKELLLGLLAHEHPTVKYHALKSLQVLMLDNYETFAHHFAGRHYMHGLAGLPEFQAMFDKVEEEEKEDEEMEETE